MRMENFEQCLARLIKEHKLNYSELTNLLNYRSKNTLHRILTGESGEKSRSKVFNDIVNNDNIGFSKKDIEELELALEISLIGNEKFEAMSEMRNLLRKNDVKPEEVYITDIESMKLIPLGELKNKIKDFDNEIIIINCCWAAISRCLTELMAESPNTKILHYMVISDDTAETIRKIGRILPMIFNHGYMGYSVRKKMNDINIPNELSYNLIAIRSKTKSGKMYGYQLIMNNENRGYLTNESYHLFDYLQNIVTQNNQKALQIKTTYDQISSADAYLKFTEHYYKMEANNTIYTFKPDICFNYVNAEITKAAFFDGIKQLGIEDLFTNSIVKKLEAVHQKRFENIFTKKKVTQHVCTEKGLKNFAQ